MHLSTTWSVQSKKDKYKSEAHPITISDATTGRFTKEM